jgi:phosphoglycerate dehydrogenase-like enzyme
MLHVHIQTVVDEVDRDPLLARLDPAIRVTWGETGSAEARGAEIVVGGAPSAEDLANLPVVRAVIVPWAGVPQRLRDTLAERAAAHPAAPPITVHNLHHNAASTAEMALALLFAATKFLGARERDFRAEGWPERTWHDRSSILLAGKECLILGYGAVGRRVAHVCAAVGMNVRALRRRASAPARDGGIEVFPAAALHDLLPRTNVLIVTLPDTAATIGLIGAAELGMLRRPSLVVNVGRGPVIDEEALYRALADGRVDAAGLDVWWQYPMAIMSNDPVRWPSRFPFHELDNVAMSPHRGGLTREDMDMRMAALAELLNAAARDEAMPNRVDLEAGY